MVQFECPRLSITTLAFGVSFTFDEFPFPIFSPALLLPLFLSPQYKEMVYYGRHGQNVDFFLTKSVQQEVNGLV